MSDRDALNELRRVGVTDGPTVLLHYLYFPSKKAASVTASSLKRNGFSTEVRLGADGVNWLVLARHTVVPTEELLDRTRAVLEALAGDGQGEYDGWEAEVP